MNSLVDRVSAWPGVSGHGHRFGGVEFRAANREIGHVHAFGAVDIPFTVKIRDALIRSGRAERHRWLPDSGWTTVRINQHGIENALTLLRFSYLRIQTKSANIAAAAALQKELESLSLDPEVLRAAGVVGSVAAAQA